jgi:hypothetical protein
MSRINKIKTSTYFKNHCDIIFVSILVIIGIVTHINWFNPLSNFSYADFRYIYEEQARMFGSTSTTWLPYKSWGLANVQLYFYPLYLFWALIANLGMTAMFAIKLSHFMPMAILIFVSPYLLVKSITAARSAAFLAAIFYATNTHFIYRQQHHYTIAFVFAVAPLLFWAFITALDSQSHNFNRKWLRFVLILCASILYEPRITFIATIALGVYFLFQLATFGFGFFTMRFKPLTASLAILLAINCFWLLPTILGGLSSDMSSLVNRGTIAESHYSIARAITLSDHSWTGGALATGTPQPVQLYLWVAPLLACSSFFFIKYKPQLRIMTVCFGIIAILGIFLTKQNGLPLLGSFDLIRETIPGFSVFRTASPFYLLTALGFTGLIGILFCSLLAMQKNRWILPVAVSVLFVTVGLNIRPMLNGDIKGNLVNYTIPAAYLSLKDKLINDEEEYRILWLPIKSRWGYTDARHPSIDIREVFDVDSSSPVKSLVKDTPILEGIKNIWGEGYTDYLLDDWAVKYVVLPQPDSNVDIPDNYAKFKTSQDELDDILGKVPYLKRVDLGLEGMIVYENEGYSSKLGYFDKVYRVAATENFNSVLGYFHRAHKRFQAVITEDPEVPFIKTIFNFEDREVVSVTNSTLIIDESIGDLMYSYQEREVKLYIADNKVSSGDKLLIDIQPRLLATLSLDTTKKHYINYQGAIYPLKPSGNNNLSFISEINIKDGNRLEVFEIEGSEFKHTGFSGYWSGQVSDCGKRDNNNPEVSGEIMKRDNQDYISLRAGNHTACTTIRARVSRQGKLLFNMPYQLKREEKAGFAIITLGDKDKSVYRTLLSSEEGVQVYTELVDLKGYVGEVDIYLYDIANEIQNTPTLFGSPNLVPVLNTSSVPFGRVDRLYAEHNNLSQGVLSLITNTKNSKPPELNNASFESGAWTKNVEDCSAYDERPLITQDVVQGISSEGAKSLRLTSKRHTACTTTSIDLEPGRYEISFDYRTSMEGAGYFFGAHSGDQQLTKAYNLAPTDNEWTGASSEFALSSNARLNLGVYARELKNKVNVVYYDNFKLTKLPHHMGKYILIEGRGNQATYKPILDISDDVTKISAKIFGCSDEYIFLSVRYSRGWVLRDNLQSEAKKPLRTVSGMNLWPSEGSTKENCSEYQPLMFLFTPQRWFYLGGLISLTTLAGCIGYLVYDWRKRRKLKIKSAKLKISGGDGGESRKLSSNKVKEGEGPKPKPPRRMQF